MLSAATIGSSFMVPSPPKLQGEKQQPLRPYLPSGGPAGGRRHEDITQTPDGGSFGARLHGSRHRTPKTLLCLLLEFSFTKRGG